MSILTFLWSKVPNGLGVLTTVLVVTGALGFMLRQMQQQKLLVKVPYGKPLLRLVKQYHKYLAGAALIIGPIHGFMVLGKLILHTGYLLMGSIFIMFFIYLLGRLKILKSWLVWHRRTAILVGCLWLVHYIKPWLFL